MCVECITNKRYGRDFCPKSNPEKANLFKFTREIQKRREWEKEGGRDGNIEERAILMYMSSIRGDRNWKEFVKVTGGTKTISCRCPLNCLGNLFYGACVLFALAIICRLFAPAYSARALILRFQAPSICLWVHCSCRWITHLCIFDYIHHIAFLYSGDAVGF